MCAAGTLIDIIWLDRHLMHFVRPVASASAMCPEISSLQIEQTQVPVPQWRRLARRGSRIRRQAV